MNLRALFAKKADPYAGADMSAVARIAVPAWLVTAAVAIVLLPLVPPTMRLGAWGWLPAAAAVAVCLGAGALVRRRGASWSPDQLLVSSYVGIALVALLQFLAGGNHSPFASLFLLWAVYTAASHPPRRTAVYLAVVALLFCSSLVYDGWDTLAATSIGVQLFLLVTLSLMATFLVSSFRSQRVGMREEGEADRRTARTDQLTGLGNRRAFDEALARALASSEPLAVLVADVNEFKSINDLTGHLNGDEALREVAAALLESAREHDETFRWGGDEFAVLLRDTRPERAEALAERMRDAVSKRCRRPDGSPLTISTGVGRWDASITASEILESADLALMGAKLRRGADDSAADALEPR